MAVGYFCSRYRFGFSVVVNMRNGAQIEVAWRLGGKDAARQLLSSQDRIFTDCTACLAGGKQLSQAVCLHLTEDRMLALCSNCGLQYMACSYDDEDLDIKFINIR